MKGGKQMNLMTFGRRLSLCNIEFHEYLHRYIAETLVLYKLLGDLTPSNIGVNILENGAVEYIILESIPAIEERVALLLTVPVVDVYGKTILVRISKSDDVYVINMVDANLV